jgi:hypothetical protein
MEASIHSQDHDNFGSSGKKYQVSASEFELKWTGEYVYLSAFERETYTPVDSAAVTPIRDTKRSFRLRVSASELKRIINTATEAKLLKLAAEVACDLKR